MRALLDAERLRRFIDALGQAARGPGTVYLTGGASAVLVGWRTSTVDVDLKLDPEPAGAFDAIARLKDELDVNVELASPDQFIPALPGWRERSRHITRVREVTFCHYDYYAQALAKLERAHARDIADVEAMVERGLVERGRVAGYFDDVRAELVRYPAIDVETYAASVAEFVGRAGKVSP